MAPDVRAAAAARENEYSILVSTETAVLQHSNTLHSRNTSHTRTDGIRLSTHRPPRGTCTGLDMNTYTNMDMVWTCSRDSDAGGIASGNYRALTWPRGPNACKEHTLCDGRVYTDNELLALGQALEVTQQSLVAARINE